VHSLLIGGYYNSGVAARILHQKAAHGKSQAALVVYPQCGLRTVGKAMIWAILEVKHPGLMRDCNWIVTLGKSEML
jgi:hypothetical protein